MKRLGMLMVLAMGSAALAQQNGLEITPQSGTWFICVTSFTGPDPRRTEEVINGPNPRQQASELATELRAKHRLNAYIFDRGDEERRKQEEEIRRYREMFPGLTRVKTHKIQDQVAVLVGPYRDMEAARDALDSIRKIKPSEQFCRRGEQVVAGKSETGEDGYVRKVILYSPFVNAFVAHNPTVRTVNPNEGTKDLETVFKEIDVPLLKKLNYHEPRSLLKCGKPWTLVIATFQSPYKNVGVSSPLTKGINKMLGKEEDQRSASAENAQKFAEVMANPKMLSQNGRTGLDTYVLHTSYYSIVTVGAFESESDPRMRQIQELIMRMQVKGQNCMLARPMPMPVPR
jgi:hypothetical protein